MRCACCGMEIQGQKYGPYRNSEYYCERCWYDPSLFFPDKPGKIIKHCTFNEPCLSNGELNLIEIIDLYRQQSINPNKAISDVWNDILGKQYIKIPVMQARQKNILLYFGKIKAYELLLLSSVDQWSDNDCDGYQRNQYNSKKREIKDYLQKCPIPLIPAILGSIKDGQFISENGDCFGYLELPIIPGSIALLDGQQRTSGFEVVFQEFKEYIKNNDFDVDSGIIEPYYELFNFELPIVLINSIKISDTVRTERKLPEDINPTDIERAFFFIINKTQKAVNASLKDELAYKTITAGIRGIPVIEKELWRTEVVPIANSLNNEQGPLEGLINLGGVPGLKKPIQLNGFVTSLKSLFSNEQFMSLTAEEKRGFLHAYWGTIRDIIPETFDKDSYSKFLLTKSIGIYSLNYLANDLFNHCLNQRMDPLSKENLRSYLYPLKNFDWSMETSPFAILAGKKGVKKAREMMMELVKVEGVN